MRLERLARALLAAETLDADQAYEAAGLPRRAPADTMLPSAAEHPGLAAHASRSGEPMPMGER